MEDKETIFKTVLSNFPLTLESSLFQIWFGFWLVSDVPYQSGTKMLILFQRNRCKAKSMLFLTTSSGESREGARGARLLFFWLKRSQKEEKPAGQAEKKKMPPFMFF